MKKELICKNPVCDKKVEGNNKAKVYCYHKCTDSHLEMRTVVKRYLVTGNKPYHMYKWEQKRILLFEAVIKELKDVM